MRATRRRKWATTERPASEVNSVRRKQLQKQPRGGTGSMGQSGRVRRRGPGGQGALVGSRPRPGRSPPACRPCSPGTRSALAPRPSSATSRPTPHSLTRSCSREAGRVAVSSSSAWMCGGSWSRSPPLVYRSASPSSPHSSPGVRLRGGRRLIVKFSGRMPVFHVGGLGCIPGTA